MAHFEKTIFTNLQHTKNTARTPSFQSKQLQQTINQPTTFKPNIITRTYIKPATKLIPPQKS